MSRGSFRWSVAATAALLIPALTACGDREPEAPELYPVTGTVLKADGSPWDLGAGMVELKSLSPEFRGVAVGRIQEGGEFELGTSTVAGRGPGAVAGEHQVIIQVPDPNDPQIIHPVTLPETVTVQTGENRFEFKLPAS